MSEVSEEGEATRHRAAVHRPARRWDVLAVIAVGGALGSVARLGVNHVLPRPPGAIPVATWVENLSGAFLLGVLMVLVLERWPPTRYVRPFLGVGVLGGYTTFSTYMLDVHGLLRAAEPARAALYLAGTLVTGLLAVVAGVALARVLVKARTGRRSR